MWRTGEGSKKNNFQSLARLARHTSLQGKVFKTNRNETGKIWLKSVIEKSVDAGRVDSDENAHFNLSSISFRVHSPRHSTLDAKIIFVFNLFRNFYHGMVPRCVCVYMCEREVMVAPARSQFVTIPITYHPVGSQNYSFSRDWPKRNLGVCVVRRHSVRKTFLNQNNAAAQAARTSQPVAVS